MTERQENESAELTLHSLTSRVYINCSYTNAASRRQLRTSNIKPVPDVKLTADQLHNPHQL